MQLRFCLMQGFDHDDPRPPYVQIAAAIRAAILNGELEPEKRLPTGDELAGHFGVTRATVSNALRVLRQEGYIDGVYVRGQASLPASPDHELAGAAAFLFEMGYLKNLSRAGWLRLGIKNPETVAEHSFRVAIVGMALAAAEDADIGHTAALCAFHDAHETRIGDVPAVGRAYITTAVPEAITAHQTASLPERMAKAFQNLTAEYEAGKTVEARVARDADKLETLLQAAEYGTQGHNTGAWRETSIAALRTDTAKRLAQAITAADPAAWWADFAASYHELRASAQKRARQPASGGWLMNMMPGDSPAQ